MNLWVRLASILDSWTARVHAGGVSLPNKNLKIWIAASLAVLWLGGIAGVSEAKGREPFSPPAKQTLEVRGFSKNGKEVALFVKDANRGALFQVRKVRKNKLVRAYPVRGSEKGTWRKVKREHNIVEPLHDSPDNPRKDLTLVVTPRKGELVIQFSREGRLTEYERVALLEGRKGKPTKAFVKQMAWGPKGKSVAIVYHQKVKDLLTWEGDFVHTFKVKSYRLGME
jgi:hypothetical protein